MTQEFLLLVHGKYRVGQPAFRIASSWNAIALRSGFYALASQGMNLEAQGVPAKAGGLASQATVTPKAHGKPSYFALELRAAIPYPPLLIVNHASEIANQIDHHRHAPFGDWHIKDSLGIGGAHLPFGKVQAQQLLEARRTQLNPFQGGQFIKIGRRPRTKKNISLAQKTCRQGARFVCNRVCHDQTKPGHRLQPAYRRLAQRHINEQLFHEGESSSSIILPGTLLNSPLPGTNGNRFFISGVSAIPKPGLRGGNSRPSRIWNESPIISLCKGPNAGGTSTTRVFWHAKAA